MGRQLKVYLNDIDGQRKLVDAELVKENEARIHVRLSDGNIIVRRKARDLPQGEKK